MLIRDWYYRRSKLEICSIVLIPILILTIIIMGSRNNTKDSSNADAHKHEEKYCRSTDCVKAAKKFSDIINPNVDPCGDFYEFVCGNFIKPDNELSEISSFLDYHTKIVRNKLKQIVIEPVKNNDTNSIKLAKQLFQVCKEEHNATEDWKIRKITEDLGGWPLIKGNQWKEDEFNWTKTMIKARELGLDFNWFIKINEDAHLLQINLPSTSTKSDESLKSFHKYFMKKVASHFLQAGNHQFNNTEIDEIIDFEEKLVQVIEQAKLSYKPGDHLFLKVESITKKWPQLDWLNFLNNITIPNVFHSSTVIMNFIETYFDKLLKLLEETPKRTVANYIVWEVILTLSPYMSKVIQDDVMNYLTMQSRQTYDISDVCYGIVTKRMENVLESEYYRRNNIKSFENNFVLNDLIEEIQDRIRYNKWMDDSTKDKGIVRYDQIKRILGGPDNFQDAATFDKFNGYDNFQFATNNITDMIIQLNLNKYETEFNRIAWKAYIVPRVAFLDWSVANAFFLIGLNTLVVSLGILQDDYFKAGRPNYLNYGGIGWILSHELSHALDGTYHQYLHGGHFIDWISQESLEEYRKRLQCVTNDYTEIVTKQLHSNITENIVEDSADFIAPDTAYLAYQKVKKYDLKLPNLEYNQNQLFWMQYGSSLCYKKVHTHSIIDDDQNHAVPKFRINGPLRNSKYFGADFNCSVGTFMNPEHKCDLI